MPLINVRCGKDQTIRELAELVAKAVGFDGNIQWDTSKPGGTPKKLLGASILNNLGWNASVSLEEKILLAYQE